MTHPDSHFDPLDSSPKAKADPRPKPEQCPELKRAQTQTNEAVHATADSTKYWYGFFKPLSESGRVRVFLAGVFLGAWLCAMAGCSGEADSSSNEDKANHPYAISSGQSVAPATNEAGQPLRVVSLLPGITSLIQEMGYGHALVGRAAWDPVAEPKLPVVHGSSLDAEALVLTKPTHVIVSSGATGLDPQLVALSEQLGFEVLDYDYPKSIDEAMAVLVTGDSDTAGLGESLGLDDAAHQTHQRLIAELNQTTQASQSRLQAAEKNAADGQVADRPRVLAVFGLEPVMALGPKTVIGQLLERLGAQNVVTAPQTAQLDYEGLIVAKPDVIVFLKPDAAPLAEDLAADSRTQGVAHLPVPAIENGRVVLINDPTCLISGGNIPKLAQQLAQALSGDFE